jgi:hypothetical protein
MKETKKVYIPLKDIPQTQNTISYRLTPIQTIILSDDLIPNNIDYVEVRVDEYVIVDKELGLGVTVPQAITS